MLTDHVCRVCFGRILRRAAGDGQHRVYRCTNCGQQTTARAVSSLCACGAAMRTGRNLGLRCVRNPDPRPELPNEIVARLTETPTLLLEHDDDLALDAEGGHHDG